jgi:hypothetical protein
MMNHVGHPNIIYKISSFSSGNIKLIQYKEPFVYVVGKQLFLLRNMQLQ